MSSDSSQIARLLHLAGRGDRGAIDQIFEQVHAELRRIAQAQLYSERIDHTLTPTALINEAYLKLVAHTPARIEDRQHFFAIAARAMRQVLVTYAQRRAALKRGGDQLMITLGDSGSACRAEEILALDRALQDLRDLDPRLAQIVEYRFFAGLTQDEIAAQLGVSPSTAGRGWRTARAWLRRALA